MTEASYQPSLPTTYLNVVARFVNTVAAQRRDRLWNYPTATRVAIMTILYEVALNGNLTWKVLVDNYDIGLSIEKSTDVMSSNSSYR